MRPPLLARPIVIHIRRDLAEMTPGAILALMWRKLTPRMENDYRAGFITASVSDVVSMVPRNQTELWPARIVSLKWWNGIERDAVVSVDENGEPLVTLGLPKSVPGQQKARSE